MYTAAIIGAGFIARAKHLPAWLRLRRRVRLVALCDQDLPRTEALSSKYGIPATYNDAKEMLEAERPDFVDICTPPSTHAELAVAALAAGAHVLVEKPLAATVAACEQIMEAERHSSGCVGVAHSELYYPPVIEARRQVGRGEIGDFMGMRIFRSTPIGDMTADPNHWVHQLPGGAIGETGPHVVYLTQAFIDPIREVTVHARKLLPQYPWSPLEDYRLALAGDEATCSAVVTYTNQHAAAHVDLWGTEGMLRLELQSRVLVDYDRRRRDPKSIGISAFKEAAQTMVSVIATGAQCLSGRFRNSHDALIRDFFERCIAGLPPTVTSADGHKTVQTLSEICRQLQSPGEERKICNPRHP